MNLTASQIQSYDVSQDKELSRLLTAAVVNQNFRNLLLTNPPSALSNGYNGEMFEFTPDAQALIFSIRASSLEEFAAQLVLGQSNGNGSNGNGSNGKSAEKLQAHKVPFRTIASGNHDHDTYAYT
jgi:hypothetical protein